jgi:hypothetical protein
MKCYVTIQDVPEVNMTSSISQVVSGNFAAVHEPGSMTNLIVDPGAMGMNIHILSKELNIPPFEDFANEEIFQDNPNRLPNYVLSSVTNVSSEIDAHNSMENNSFGSTLVFLNNEEWIANYVIYKEGVKVKVLTP